MKVLMLSIDNKIFEKGSTSHSRMLEYSTLVEELHIVVYTRRGFEFTKVGNLYLYPTNTKFRVLYFFQAYYLCKKILKWKKQFLITSQEAMTNLLAVFLKFRFSIPLQVQIHTDFESTYFKKESTKNGIRYVGYRVGVKCADCVRVVSEKIKGSLSRGNVSVLPIFSDVEKIKNAPVVSDLHKEYPQFETIILMVSRLEREKNISLALRVFKKVLEKHPRVGLVVVGDGSELERLKIEASNLSVSNNVVFLGNVNYVASLYKTADVFLHTSNYEGYGLVFVEASVAGCPIVTTDVGVVSEFFEDGVSAEICPVGDEDCLVEKLAELIEGKEMRRALARASETAVLQNLKIKTNEQYLKRQKELWERCVNTE